MNVFLFLYPIKPYIDHKLERWITRGVIERQMQFFNELIEGRYRDTGYRVAWLLFCNENDNQTVDRKIIDSRVVLQPDDILVNAGVPFSDDPGTWVYPSEKYIFSQLPQDISHLRIGGFHYSDCVSRVGEYAYRELGMVNRVLIDEDLALSFWVNSLNMFDPVYAEGKDREDPYNNIPIHREMSYEGLGYTAMPDWETDSMWVYMRKMRSSQPWFVHE